jgi:hypothetical protein
VESSDVRLDVKVAPPARPDVTRMMYLLLFCGAALALREPWTLGVPLVLPLLFAALGARAVRAPRDVAYTVRVDAETFVVETVHYVARTPLTHLRRVVQTAEAMVVSLPSGDVPIPLAALQRDPRRLLDALPAQVAFEVAPAPANTGDARKTLALWIVLMLLLGAAYRFLGGR